MKSVFLFRLALAALCTVPAAAKTAARLADFEGVEERPESAARYIVKTGKLVSTTTT